MTCAMSGVVLGEGARPVPSCSSTTVRSSVLTVWLITAGRGKSHHGEPARGVLRGFCIPEHTHVFVFVRAVTSMKCRSSGFGDGE